MTKKQNRKPSKRRVRAQEKRFDERGEAELRQEIDRLRKEVSALADARIILHQQRDELIQENDRLREAIRTKEKLELEAAAEAEALRKAARRVDE